MAANKCPTSFTEDGNYLAYPGTDGNFRILDTVTGSSIADFAPNSQLTMICCTKWSRGRHLSKSQSLSVHSSRKKKKKESDVETAVGDQGLVAMGTTNGSIFLYSFSKEQLHSQLEKGHTAAVTDVCWHPSSTTLYSSSLDGHVVEWDVPSSRIKRKWKASNEGVHSICLCGSNRLLTADRSIKMWDLSSKKVIQKFKGHSTEVFRLLPVPLQSSGREDGDNDASACSYFISAAANDKIVNAWLCHPDSSEKNAVTSFSLTEEPAELTLQVTKDQMLILSVLTTKGKVLIFEHTLNGKLQKPLKAQTVVQATTEGSQEEVPVPVPILAAVPTAVSSRSPSLLVAHGSLRRPRFSSVALRPARAEIPLVVPKPDKKATKADHMQMKTADKVAGSAALHPSHTASAGPNKEGSARRKRKKSASNLTLTERLDALGVDRRGQASASGKPRGSQLVDQLIQGLENEDAKLLTTVFQEQKEKVIQTTVKNLPLPVIDALVKEIARRIQGHPSSGLAVVKWMKQIMLEHMGYIKTVPDILETLQELIQYIHLQQALPQVLEARAKTESLLARVATQDEEDEPSASAEAMLLYDDDSETEEANWMDIGASESEGNWEDSDMD